MVDPVLDLRDVSIRQMDTFVLLGVNVEIYKGEFVFLIGRTGSGKSSLIRTLYADLPLYEGYGHIVGYDLTKIKKKQIPYLRRDVGIVFQDFKLLPDRNIYDNMSFVLKSTGWKNKSDIKDCIYYELSNVGMENKAFKFPHQLSGGEQQRVAIARALLNDPTVIIADEPTGNLDPQTSSEVIQLFRYINEQSGRTVLIATHDYSTISQFPSRILRCSGGRVFEVDEKATL